MNILWIEDSPDESKESLKDLVGDDKFIFKPNLSSEENDYSECSKSLLTPLFDFDYFIIDINLGDIHFLDRFLTSKYNEFKDAINKEGMSIAPNKTFLREAGFHYYIDLILKSVPNERIVFYSANVGQGNDTGTVFRDRFRSARMPSPIYIEKNENTSKNRFKDFFDKTKDEHSYITLRRGIIEACDEIIEYLSNEDKTDELIFNDAENVDDATIEQKDSQYFIEYFKKLRRYFPIKKPENDEINKLYYSFLSELSAEWESKQHFFPYGKHDKFLGCCLIQMKVLRNFTSHHIVRENEIDDKLVAFHFIIALFAIVKFDPDFDLSSSRWFNYLLNLFPSSNTNYINEHKILETKLKDSYTNLIPNFDMKKISKENRGKTKIEIKSRRFHSCLRSIKKGVDNSVLYQNLWHSLYHDDNPFQKENLLDYVGCAIDEMSFDKIIFKENKFCIFKNIQKTKNISTLLQMTYSLAFPEELYP